MFYVVVAVVIVVDVVVVLVVVVFRHDGNGIFFLQFDVFVVVGNHHFFTFCFAFVTCVKGLR